MAKEVNGTRSDYLLMGSEVLKTYENGAPKAEYFLGLGRHGIKTDNAWKYYLTDGLGSTVSLTDDTGSTVAAYDYDDYGETSQIAGSTSVYNPFLYTGQEWDAELGMYNLRARHYSPTVGRFLARDPIGHAGGSNIYSYCSADPINFSDPSGLDALQDASLEYNNLYQEYVKHFDKAIKSKQYGGWGIVDALNPNQIKSCTDFADELLQILRKIPTKYYDVTKVYAGTPKPGNVELGSASKGRAVGSFPHEAVLVRLKAPFTSSISLPDATVFDPIAWSKNLTDGLRTYEYKDWQKSADAYFK